MNFFEAPRPPRLTRRGARVSLRYHVLGVLLGWAVLGGPTLAAEPVKIGALTESWGPTPAMVGLRDGLKALGYRDGEQFVIGVRFTQGRPGTSHCQRNAAPTAGPAS
jgi:hypothetical protein